jgi:anthranilate synthase component 1
MSTTRGSAVAGLGARQVRVLQRALRRVPDPVAAYAALCAGRPGTLLLESADQSTGSGSKSLVLSRSAVTLLGRGREVTLEAKTASGRNVLAWMRPALADRAEVEGDDNRLRACFAPLAGGSELARLTAPSPLDAVREALLGLELLGDRAAPPLVAGSFAYDLLDAFETLPAASNDPTRWPDFELSLAEELLWIDHEKRRSQLLRYVYGGPHAETAYHDATRALAQRIEQIETLGDGAASDVLTPLPPDDAAVSCNLSDAEYAALVRRAKRHIVEGDVFQIVPSRAFTLPCSDPLGAYRVLRALNPSPYMFLVHGSEGVLFGASPESALRVDGVPRQVKISPIAGTRQRGRHADGSIDADLDTRIEAELRLDHKEVAEHMMLVDLARNDVARVCRPGSRAVSDLLHAVRYSHVMHLVSQVQGELRDDLDALHAYLATMNMGTLVGAPKLRAAELLRRFEPDRRGPYGGAVGYLTAHGELDSCVVIRSALVRDGVARVQAGAGVVFDSDPDAEALETRRKARAVLGAIARAEEAKA